MPDFTIESLPGTSLAPDSGFVIESLTPEEQSEADVRAGRAPEYFKPIFGKGRLDRLSDQLSDPIGLQDEMVGVGQALKEFVTGARAKKAGNPSIWNSAGDAYNEAANYVRAARRVARQENTIAPEIVGGLAQTAISKVAGPALTWAQGLKPAAKAGAAFGGATGYAQGEGGVGERVADATEGALVGAVAAPVISSVIVPGVVRTVRGVRDAARYAGREIAGARNPEAAAIRNVADRMVNAGIDPAAMRASVSPPPSSQLAGRVNPKTGQNFNAEDMANIISRSAKGETDAVIGADYGIHPTTVGNYVRTFEANNPTPMNPIDLAKEMVGQGGAGPVTRLARAAHSLAGDESGAAAQRLTGRQDTQAGRVQNIVQRSVAGGDFEATRTAGLKNLKDEAETAYGAFRAEPDLATNALDDLMADPLFKQAAAAAQQQARVSAMRRNQQLERSNAQARANGQPEQPLEPVPYSPKNDPQHQALRMEREEAKDALTEARRRRQDATSKEEKRAALEDARIHEDTITAIDRELQELSSGDTDVFSPQLLDNIQRQLRIISEGKLGNPTAAQHARDLREVFLDRIEKHYTNFRDIRRNYAAGKGEYGEEGALEAGRELTTKLGAKASEALRGFAEYTPAQQELFRLGFARKLMDEAANPQIGGAVANKFNSPAVREIVETLYPKSDAALYKQGQKLLRDLNRETITTSTKNDVMVGARTAELGSDMGRMMEGAQAAADLTTGRWGKLLENLSTRLTTQLGRRGAKEVLNILTETDPAQLLPTLNRLARAAATTKERQAYVSAMRDVISGQIARTAPTVGIGVGEYATRQ